jgi:ubiquinone/menaquinone biosynthesis C-methylase UbiE
VNDRFIPGRVDYAGRIARGFNTGRAVQPHAQEVWHSALKPYFGSASRILDVGAGTGRFAVLLAQWFGASIIGV